MSAETVSLIRVFPSSGVPIYRQVMEQIHTLLLSGQLREGDLLPSVRSTASALEVNPMTVSKAYSMLESEGVVERIRGLGMRVRRADADISVQERMEELTPLFEQVAGKAHQLALSREEVLAALEPFLRQLNDSRRDSDGGMEVGS